jgi:hypothetical protein
MLCKGNYKIISVNHAREKEKNPKGKNKKNPQSLPHSISLKVMFPKEKTPEQGIAANQNITSGDETLIMIPPTLSKKGGRKKKKKKTEILQSPLIPLN